MQGTPLYTVAQVRQFDRNAIAQHGVAGCELMQRAAAAAFAYLRARWPEARRIVVYCGGGNNGGDGYVLARLARAAQFDVAVVAAGMPRPGSDAERACRDWREGGGALLDAESAPRAGLIVDALLGTGLKHAPQGAVAACIGRINAAAVPVLALDVPSGLDADSGAAPGSAVRAAATVTFVAHKRGLFTGAASAHCGTIVLDALQLPDDVFAASAPDAVLLDATAGALPARASDAHKGDFGHVLAIGGDLGTGGAIRLSGEAALRVGAGLVSVATRAENVSALNAARPEIMARGIDGPQELDPMLARASVVAIGPGLGQRAWAHGLWHAAIAAGKPLVLDADALNLLAREAQPLPHGAILTPHPGEAARLAGSTAAAVNSDRFHAVRALARRFDAVVVLKGAGTLIGRADGAVAVCPFGNSGMASGGVGDVLTGVVAGLRAQGLDAWTAACAGVVLHARAGDAAARAGAAGLAAADLFAPLRALRNGIDP